jgi:hypothetical protein
MAAKKKTEDGDVAAPEILRARFLKFYSGDRGVFLPETEAELPGLVAELLAIEGVVEIIEG